MKPRRPKGERTPPVRVRGRSAKGAELAQTVRAMLDAKVSFLVPSSRKAPFGFQPQVETFITSMLIVGSWRTWSVGAFRHQIA